MDIKYKLTNGQRNILLLLDRNGTLRFMHLETCASIQNTLENEDYYDFSRVVSRDAFGNMFFYKEFEKDIKGLELLGLIKFTPENYSSLTWTEVNITKEGERIADRIANKRNIIFRPSQTERSSIFIACAFGHDEIDKLFEEEFYPACKKLGYESVRVDMTEPSRTITELIMSGITEAECVVADLSFARPSVYFEVGFAHGLGIPIILTCNSDHYHGDKDDKRVHFDLEQYKISYWSISSKAQFEWKKGMKPYDRLRKIVPKRIKQSE